MNENTWQEIKKFPPPEDRPIKVLLQDKSEHYAIVYANRFKVGFNKIEQKEDGYYLSHNEWIEPTHWKDIEDLQWKRPHYGTSYEAINP